MKTQVLLFCFALAPSMAAESAVEIIRRSLDLDRQNLERAKDYTYQQKSVTRELDGNGKLKKTESRLTDILMLYGRPFGRLVEKDGKPLSDKEKSKEDERFEKEVEKRRRETAEENTKERRRYEERRAKQRAFAREVPEAFNFTLAGEETVGGHPAYAIVAEPKPGFKPHDMQSKFLSKVHGKLWIDKKELQWVKVEAETTDSISFGWFLASLGPGATLRFEQRRVNDELWLPAHVAIKLDARALFKKMRGDVDIEYSNYRKFQTDSKIIIPE